ncbi:MAG: GTP-binding protein, partial [Gammaproteobacteria bacterium]|nr:GTP-binding protein [Gammaproteobacteria bacterium]
MSRYTSDQIRNIALAGHAGAGKTLLADALLHAAGAIRKKGEIARGTTVCDFDPKEKELGHSLESALCHFDHDDIHVNLIDTPGYPDFLGRAIAVLPAVETVAVVINAQSGIELSTQRIMEVAKAYGMCRMVIINRIDAPDTNLHAVLRAVRETFGNECLPLNLPADNGARVVDCFFEMSEEKTDFASVAAAHTEMVDQVVEVDEKLMELYLEQGEELSLEQLHDPFEKALRSGHLIPVCFTSAETGVGIRQLLNIFEKLMPNPNEGNPPHFLKGEGSEAVAVDLAPDPDRHAIAHVFKVSVDPFVGRLGIFRIHQGTIKTSSQLYIGDARKPFKVAHLLAMQGKDHVEVPRGIPGDIRAVAKIDDIEYD